MEHPWCKGAAPATDLKGAQSSLRKYNASRKLKKVQRRRRHLAAEPSAHHIPSAWHCTSPSPWHCTSPPPWHCTSPHLGTSSPGTGGHGSHRAAEDGESAAGAQQAIERAAAVPGAGLQREGGRERERETPGASLACGAPRRAWPRVARRPVRARRAEPASPHDL